MIVFLIIVLLILLIPVIRFAVMRVKLITELKRICKSRNFEFLPTHKLWFTSGIQDKNCDLYIKTPSNLYSVKLCGMMRRSCEIHFKNSRAYTVKRIRVWFQMFRGFDFSTYTDKSKPEYDFAYNMREEDRAVKLTPILLMCPVCVDIFLIKGNEKVSVFPGDDIGECLFYNKTGFEELLMSEE